MEITKHLEEEITRFMDNYWATYFEGDLETWSTYLADDYKNIGGNEEEIWNSKKEIMDYTIRVMDQMKGTAQLRNKQTQVFSLEPFVLAHEFVDIYIKIEDEWTFYGKFRLSTILKKYKDSWQVIHQHGSYPDSKTDHGEAFAFDKISTENKELKEAIKRRTIELESKNRELQIEASLEKVRAVAMGMKTPDDILDICKGIFTELQLLGFSELRNSLINFWDDGHAALIDYDYSDDAGANKATILYSSHPVFDQFQQKIRQSKDSFAELVVSKDLLESWKQRRRESGEYEDPRLEGIDALYYYFYSIGVGAVGISTFNSLDSEKLNILKRFRNVFDLAYRRYQDIEQAEEQAREAQIELGLERVRARAMAMQHSDELAELVSVLFTELTHLGFTLTSCIIWIHDPEHASNTLWIASAEMNEPAEPFYVQPFHNDFFRSVIHAWKAKDPKWVFPLTGLEKRNFEDAFFNELPNLPDALKNALRDPEQVVFSASFNNFGALEIVETEVLTDEKFEILHRFGKVFDSSFTRFNDLQKAEAQVKESQIQLAMERVRARTMAMHKSEELQNVIQVVYEQFVHLDILVEHAGFILDYKTRDDMHIWLADKHTIPFQVTIPYFDCAHWKSFIEAKEKQLDFFSNNLSFEEKNKFYRDLFQLIPGVPEESLQYYLSCPGLAISTVLLDNIGLYIENFSGIPYTAEENNTLMRMGKVFQQTYTRFLDLQKAEAQAKEAQVETALERVRSRSMAMHKSEELADLSLELVKQVQALGVATWFCAFNIYDDDPQGSLEWGSNGQGTFPRYRTPREGIFLRYFEAGQRGEILLINEIGVSECAAHYEYLCSLPGVGDQLLKMKEAGIPFPVFQIDHVAFFKYGYIIFITYEPVPEAHDIFKRFAKVFEQTYTRFLDLQKAEAQATEAKIEAALERTRTQSMIMQHSKELDDTLRVFHEQVLLLGIQSAFSYLWLPDEKNDRHIFWAAWGEEKNGTTVFKSKAINYPLDRQEPATAQCLVDWKSESTLYSYYVPPAGVENYFNVWHELIDGVEHLRPQFFVGGLYYVEAFMKYGCFGVMVSTDLNDDDKKLLNRFAVEFERTYTRFLDLQKAEAQAREAQIEAGLERVRSRSLAMHNTSELQEVIHTVHKELLTLDIAVSGGSFIAINSDIRNELLCWGSGGTADTSEEVHVPLYEEPFCTNLINGIKKGPGFFTEEFTQAEKKEFFTFLFKHEPWSTLDAKQKNETLSSPGGYTRSCCVSKHTSIFIINHFGEKFSEAENNILRRFGKSFEQTYTRFLDLQKAEAQTREAQINLAVERVRAKALAMFKSEEILDVVFKLREEIMGLNIPNVLAATIHLKEADGRCRIWDITSLEMADGKIHQPLDIKYRLEDTDPNFFMRRIWDNASGYFIVKQDEDDFKRTIQWLRECDSLQQADDTEQFLASTKIKELFHPTVQLESGRMCIDLLDIPTAEVESILTKMGGAFDLAYKRFEDLQKAEAQAREAQIELGLERVRARAMAMQKSGELSELVDTVFKELTKLDFALSWCMINIIDEPSMSNTVWGANPDIGKAPESYHMLFEDYRFHHEMFQAWKEKKSKWTIVLEGKEKEIYDEYLFNQTEFRRVPEHVQKQMRATKKYEGAFTFSNFGGLQTIGEEPLSEANMDILARFGKVFDLTYTRFNDLKLAEAQAMEARIEAALERVRSRSMAMHNSNELLEAGEIIFVEMQKLGIESLTAGYVLMDKEEKNGLNYTPHPGTKKIMPVPVIIPHDETIHMQQVVENWKKGNPFFIVEMDEEATIKHQTFIAERSTNFPLSAAELIAISPAKLFLHNFYFKEGYILIVGGTKLSVEQSDIMLRFARVFQQAYTRFLDLQKAESQAREAKIEAALEKVRSRTMAMQNSDELPDAANVLFLEVQKLGIPAWSCGYNVLAKDKKSAICWMSSEGVLQEAFTLRLWGEPSFDEMGDFVRSERKILIQELAGKAIDDHYNYMKSFPDLKVTFEHIEAKGLSLPTYQVNHLCKYTHGFLLFITYEQVPDAHDIFKRFTKVFEQTYTRFLDLQKAEAQTREAKIEMALEKVRARTMGMQKSGELADVAKVLFTELNVLVHNLWTCGFVLCEKERPEDEWWLSMDDGFTRGFFLPNVDDFAHSTLYEGWLRGEAFRAVQLDGSELQAHYDWLMKVPVARSIFEEMDAAGLARPDWQKLHAAYFSKGYLVIITREPSAGEEVFKRFAQVFDLTYTRFLDLQKAEAQAREALIEAALERVRSRTMAMQKSTELQDAALLLVQQVKILGVPSFACGYNIWDENRKAATAWMAGEDRLQPPFKTSGSEDVFLHIHEAAQRGEQLFIAEQGGEELETHYRYMATIPEFRDITEKMAKAGLSVPTFQVMHCAFFSQGYLMFISFEPVPEAHDIFKRFAKVFEQTYTRFLDLQKAEAQAMEANKRASVDRVRAEIASMRTTGDLERIQPLIWNELTILSVPFIRCGVFIMDETKQEVNTLLSTPDGKAIAAFRQSYNAPGEIKAIVDSWHKKEIYKQHWDEEQFLSFAKDLVQQGAVKSGEKYLTENRPTDLHLHFLPFLQGMLYVGNTTALSDDELQLVQNLADAFATAYARYEDFNKLEAAKQQVDNTLNELQVTQKQLIQSEKMASLGELTAGIAHEIQNPLNFVNNFSDVSKELLEEMREALEKGDTEEAKEIMSDVIQNLEKINHHGKRADGIVKGMLQHSRSNSGQKEPTNINALADEYLRLAYHGLRAKDKSFNATLKTHFDENVGNINIIPQDIGRVILNLITNAFFVVDERKKLGMEGYEPIVTVSTKKINDKVEIKVADNGNGIPKKILDKIFQPFFTTKPTGLGTGLGLSLSYDIVKAHGGELKVETTEGEGSVFIISLPK